MYSTLAKLGFGIARSLRPSKLKRGMRIVGQKVGKKQIDPKKSPKLSDFEYKSLNFLNEAGAATRKIYTKGYKATLGSSTKRKVTSAALGGYTIGQIFDDL